MTDLHNYRDIQCTSLSASIIVEFYLFSFLIFIFQVYLIQYPQFPYEVHIAPLDLLSKSFKVNCLPRTKSFASIFSNSSIEVFRIKPRPVLTRSGSPSLTRRKKNNLEPSLTVSEIELEGYELHKDMKETF